MIQILQEYILAQDKKAFIDKLLPGSPESKLFSLLQNIHKSKLDQKDQKTLNQISHQDGLGLRRALFVLADESQPQKKRKEAAALIGKQLNFDMQFLNYDQEYNEDYKPQQVVYSSELDQELVSVEKLIRQSLQQNKMNFSVEMVDPLELSSQLILNYFYQISYRSAAHPNFLKAYISFLKESYRVNRYIPIQFNHTTSLSLTNVQEILKQLPQSKSNPFLARAYLLKTFWKESSSSIESCIKSEVIHKRIDSIRNILAWAKAKIPQHPSLLDDLLCQILNLSLQVNEFDFEIYQEFLNRTHFEYGNYSQTQNGTVRNRANIKAFDYTWRQTPLIRNAFWKSNQQLHQDYLQAHFRKKDCIEPFNKYFNQDFLKKKLMSSKLFRGETIQDLQNFFSASEIKSLNEERKLTITKDNSKLFQKEDQVVINIQTKNITSLTVSIFQISLKQYYLERRAQFDESIKLEGLTASTVQNFNYNDPSIRLVTRKFTFSSLKGRTGLFIVQFVGNGIMSRAVVQLGKLLIKQKTSVLGHHFSFFNQKIQKLQGKDCGMYLNNQFLPVNQEGQVVIPFGTKFSGMAVFCAGDYACLENVNILQEKYVLKCNAVLHRQSAILNNRGKMLVQPKLFLNNQIASFSIIEEAKAQISVVDMDGVAASQIVEKIPLSRFQQFQLDFPVGLKTAEINLSIKVTLKNLAGNKQTLSYESKVSFLNLASEQLAIQILRKDKDGFFIQVRDRNGQVIPDIVCRINLGIKNYFQPVNVVLQTNKQGRIRLGPLKDVISLTSQMDSQRNYHSDPIQEVFTKTLFGANYKIQLCQGDDFRYPLVTQFEDKYIFIRTSSNIGLIQILSDKLELTPNQLLIKSLTQGQYLLILPEGQLTLIVHKGEKMATGDLLVNNTTLLTVPNYPKYFNFSAQATSSEESIFVRGKVIGQTKNIRLHLLLNNFCDNFITQNWFNEPHNQSYRIKHIFSKANSYFSDKFLGDEMKYALQRKNKETFLGNTLQKPSLLVNRQFVKDTVTNNQQLKALQDFKKKDAGRAVHDSFLRPTVVRTANSYFNVSKFYDFLGSPGQLISNVFPDEHGNFSVKIPKGFSICNVLAVSQTSFILRNILIDANLSVRDLRHKPDLKNEQYFTLTRTNLLLKEKQVFLCKDTGTTKFTMIDSISRQFDTLLQLLKNNNVDSQSLQKFQFLKNWESLDPNQKNEKYSQNICNQLNIFLYFNDPQYFNQYVRPFLANKLNKKFIDYLLLEDDQEVKSYLDIQRITALGPLQLACLVYYSASRDWKEAEQLKNLVEMKYKTIKLQKQYFKKQFDTVLGSGQTKEHQQDIIQNDARSQKQFGMKMKKERKMLSSATYQKTLSSNSYKQSSVTRETTTFLKGYKQVQSTKQFKQLQWVLPENQTRFGSFYIDLSNWLLAKRTTQNFISSNFLGVGCVRDAFAVLIFNDLRGNSFERLKAQGKSIQYGIKGNVIVFQKELMPAKVREESISIFQKFSDQNQKTYYDEDGREHQKRVDEYLVGKVYNCQVVITNSTARPQELQVLAEIPQGSLPLKANFTQNRNILVQSFTTQTFEYSFYFPRQGDFGIKPANVSLNGFIVALSSDSKFRVRSKPSEGVSKTLSDILQKGNKKEIIQFIKNRNLLNDNVFDFGSIRNLFSDREFYTQVLAILRSRMIFIRQAWAFGLFHLDLQAVKELFQNQQVIDQFKQKLKYFDGKLLKCQNFSPLEFTPLINQRTHSLSDGTNILNSDLQNSYKQFLTYLQLKRTPSPDDFLCLSYFLMVQDRIKQSLDVFLKIDGEKVQGRLQYDYFRAYVDFFIDYPNFRVARQIVEKYIGYPVLSWRNRFYIIANQLSEFDGDKPVHAELQKKKQRQEFLEVSVQSLSVRVTYKNISKITVAFYPLQLQVLFSRNPLISSNSKQYSLIRASASKEYEVQASDQLKTIDIELPTCIGSMNCYIQLKGGSKSASTTFFNTSIKTIFEEDLGQLKVMNSEGKSIPRAYVKVLGQESSGTFVFFKDGYTDLRGSFDYVSKSQSNLGSITKFIVLIQSDQHGSLVRQVKRPVLPDGPKKNVQLRNSSWQVQAQCNAKMQLQSYNMNRAKNVQKRR